jgi:hypothetical protein
MNSYLYVFRGGMSGGTPAETQANMQKWGAWIKQLTEKGTFKAGEPLEQGGKVLSGKNKTLTDGPYAEAKDVIGGYLLVTARSLDDATEIARGCPIFDHGGTVEVRPVMKMDM